jgi:feruloyl-CoA synthase
VVTSIASPSLDAPGVKEFLEAFAYAAAALPESLWERLRAIADEVADHPVPLTAAWGTPRRRPA